MNKVFLATSVLFLSFHSLLAQSHVFYEHGYEITSYEDHGKFKNNRIDDIWIEKDGQLWITNTDQIHRYDGHEFVHTSFGKDAEMVDIGMQIRHIFRDSKGNIWLSRFGGDVGKYDPKEKTFESLRIDVDQGIGRDTYNIVEDQFGNIWIGLLPGLIRIPQGQIEEHEVIMLPSVLSALKPTIMPLMQNGNQIASILQVPSDTLISQTFDINRPRSVQILGMGSVGPSKGYTFSNEWVDYGWITDSEGTVIWKMDWDQSLIETSRIFAVKDQLFLSKGSYQLHYRTDKTYAYGDWDVPPHFSYPPEVPKWYGIQLLDIPQKAAEHIDSIWNQHPNNQGFHTIRSDLYQEEDGTIWVGGNGLQKLVITGKDAFHFENYLHANLASKAKQISIQALHTHDEDHLWVSFTTYEGKQKIGLLHKGNKSFREISIGEELRRPIEAMKQDREGDLWFGSSYVKGLHRLSPPFQDAGRNGSPELTRFYGDDNQLSRILDLEFDDNDNLWIGTGGRQFYKLNLRSPAIKFIQTDQFGIDSLAYVKVYKDRQKKLWLALEDPENKVRKLLEYDLPSDTYRVFNDVLTGIPTDTLEVIDEFSDGRMLLYNNRSFILFNPENQEIELLETNMDEKSIYGRFLLNDSILVSPSGKLYNIVINQEVGNLFQHLKGYYLRKYSGWISFYVTPHDSNSFWAAVKFGQIGRFRWTGQKLEPVLIQSRYIRNHGRMVSTDKKYWVAFPYLSTDPYEEGFQTNITDPELVHYLYDGNLSEAGDGKIWFLGRRGAVTYDPATAAVDPVPILDPLLVGREKYVLTHDDKSITIVRNKTPKNWHKSHIYHFHPDSLLPDTTPPHPAFASLSAQSEDTTEFLDLSWFPPAESYTFPHNQNSLTIAYKGIHFNYPEGVRYQYRMEGSSNESWIDAGEKREASFFDLAPGNYTFSFKAMNADGYWSEPLSMNITIQQPWWWSLAAKIIYLILLASGLYALYRFQLSRQLARNEAQRLAELDQVKTRLYTNITHEFRTPLTVIQGMTRKLVDQPDKWLKQGAGMIQRNTDQLLGLVNQMLDLSKLESGKLDLHPIHADVLPFFYYVMESFQALAESKNISLHLDSNQESIEMDHDPERLREVLSNLLSNAVKFTPEGGTITMRILVDQETLLLVIRDTGQGISQEQLPHIFDRFYQTDDSSTRQGEGTGIGLALCRELVQLMGGEIQVASQLGEGTEFSVSLPIQKQAALGESHAEMSEAVLPDQEASLPLPATISPDTASPLPRVLLIEDNADVVSYLISCLEADYQIDVARNGQEGIERALEMVPDLIISDVMMPEKDGFEVCYTLKQDIRTSHIPVILLTAKADMDSKLTGLRRGADAYLTKPFNEAELLIRVANLLEVRRQMQARYAEMELLPTEEAQQQIEDAFILQFRQVVMEHLDNPQLDVSLLCQELGMSRTPLHNKLKALTGMSTTEYVRFIRLAKAKELLLDPELHIAEVAYATGFQNHTYFSRKFRELVGMTPKAWREGNG